MRTAGWLGWRFARRRRTLTWLTLAAAFALALGAGVTQVVDAAGQLTGDAYRRERVGSGETLFVLHSGSAELIPTVAAAIEKAGFGQVEAAAILYESPIDVRGSSGTARVSARDWRNGVFRETLTLTQGEAPDVGSVVVTKAFAEANDVDVGSEIRVAGKLRRVAGVGQTPGDGPTSNVVFTCLCDTEPSATAATWWLVSTERGTEEAVNVLLSQYDLTVRSATSLAGTRSPLDQRPLLLVGLAALVVAMVVFVLRRAAGKQLASSALAAHAVGVGPITWRLVASVEAGVAAGLGIVLGWLATLATGPFVARWVAAVRGFSYNGLTTTPIRAALLETAVAAALVAVAFLEAAPVSAAKLRHTESPPIRRLQDLAGRLTLSHPARSRGLWLAALVGVGSLAAMTLVVDSITALDALAHESDRPRGSILLNLRGAPPTPDLIQALAGRGNGVATLVWEQTQIAAVTPLGDLHCVPLGIELTASDWLGVVGREWTAEEQAALQGGAMVALYPLNADTAELRNDAGELIGSIPVFNSRPGDSFGHRCVASVGALRSAGLQVVPSFLLTRTEQRLDAAFQTETAEVVQQCGFEPSLLYGVSPPGYTPIVVKVLVVIMLLFLAAFYSVTFIETAWDDAPTYRLLRGLGLDDRRCFELFARSTATAPLGGTMVGIVVGSILGIVVTRALGIETLVLPFPTLGATVAILAVSGAAGALAFVAYGRPGQARTW